jgi:hypothetical protein
MARGVDLTLRMAETSERAAAELKKQGLRIPNQPEDRLPRLPQDITSIHDEELMVLFGCITSWLDYVSVQVACAEIDERASQNVLDQAEASAIIGAYKGPSQDRITMAKAAAVLDPEVVRVKGELRDAMSYRKLIQTLAQNLERDAALVSRELTRRTAGISSTPSKRAARYV